MYKVLILISFLIAITTRASTISLKSNYEKKAVGAIESRSEDDDDDFTIKAYIENDENILKTANLIFKNSTHIIFEKKEKHHHHKYKTTTSTTTTTTPSTTTTTTTTTMTTTPAPGK
ncbi:hypothetical protein PVAND_005473 [Polypedilum vanderplanki]|uniref:Uncharacterized protein n=1 Tax=Polypedilum vanderplanki TaxID=319348 RepID=A0A9J6C195_POLVA|nr:hypothetical protein PVAND_005473 [Polypedilum vanderplanki]